MEEEKEIVGDVIPPRSEVHLHVTEMPLQRIFSELDGIVQYQRRERADHDQELP